MTNNTILARIILPSSTILEERVTMVNIPGKSGVFGVLPGHSNTTSNIDIGIVKIFFDKTDSEYFVYGGIAQVKSSEINIVTEFAVNLDGIKKKDITAKIEELQTSLSSLEKDNFEANIVAKQINKYQELLNYVE